LAHNNSRPEAGTKKNHRRQGNAFWDKKNGRQHLMLNIHLEGGLAKKKIESSQHTGLQYLHPSRSTTTQKNGYPFARQKQGKVRNGLEVAGEGNTNNEKQNWNQGNRGLA
jgi:hypothetical protein